MLAFSWLVVWLCATITVPNIGPPVPVELFIAFGGAAVIWMIGRAIRYALAAT